MPICEVVLLLNNMQNSPDQEKLLSQIEELKNKQQLNRKERRQLQKLETKMYGAIPVASKDRSSLKKYAVYSVISIIVIAILSGLYFYQSKQPSLPPIDMAGHVEQNPKSHILDNPMPESIQKHMLEHADGEAKNGEGVIIQYNCTQRYICEKGLVDKLKTISRKYPKNVYLAPANYSGVIILTKLGKREVLDSFDEQKIINFITEK